MVKTTYGALSDIEGKITSISLLFSTTAPTTNNVNEQLKKEILQKYGSIFDSFLEHHSFIILAYYNVYRLNGRTRRNTNSRVADFINTALLYSPDATVNNTIEPFFALPFTFQTNKKQKVKVIPIDAKKLDFLAPPPDSFAPSCWIQDYFVVLRGTRGETALLESMTYTAPSDPGNITVADHLAALHDIMLKPCLYPVKGGNVLVGSNHNNERYAFIHMQHKANGIEPVLKQLLDVTTIYWIGQREEKIQYIKTIKDQWHTYLDHTNLLTDNSIPSLSTVKMVLDQMLSRLPHLDMYLTLGPLAPDNTRIIFVGNVELHHVVGDITDPEEVEHFRQTVNNYLQDICKQIPPTAFTIQRIPCLLRVTKIQNDDEPPVQSYTLHPYNNCHIEIYTENEVEVRRVYLPDYSSVDIPQIAQIQQDITALFTSLSLESHWIKGNFQVLSEAIGSLHCLSKIVEREIPA